MNKMHHFYESFRHLHSPLLLYKSGKRLSRHLKISANRPSLVRTWHNHVRESNRHQQLTCYSSSGPRAPWHCAPGTSWSRWAACTWSSCCYRNRCWASASDPWTACGPCCQYLWAYASFSARENRHSWISYRSNLANKETAELVCEADSHRDLHISVRLVADELLGSLLDNLGLCEGPEGCHGDWGQEE